MNKFKIVVLLSLVAGIGQSQAEMSERLAEMVQAESEKGLPRTLKRAVSDIEQQYGAGEARKFRELVASAIAKNPYYILCSLDGHPHMAVSVMISDEEGVFVKIFDEYANYSELIVKLGVEVVKDPVLVARLGDSRVKNFAKLEEDYNKILAKRLAFEQALGVEPGVSKTDDIDLERLTPPVGMQAKVQPEGQLSSDKCKVEVDRLREKLSKFGRNIATKLDHPKLASGMAYWTAILEVQDQPEW